MERFAPLGKSCAPFARGDWNAALLLNTCLHIQLLPPHICPVEEHPSINSNGTICYWGNSVRSETNGPNNFKTILFQHKSFVLKENVSSFITLD